MGCTEPIAVALASAQAARALGEPPERLKVTVSPNILKNALGVGIPGTGMTGLLIASALGALGGDSSRGLEVLQGLSPERIQAAKEFVREERVEVEKCEGEGKLFIDVTAYGKGHRGRSVIRNTHTSVVLVERDGEVLESREAVEGREGEEEECAAVPMTVEEIFRFATEVPLEKIAFLEEGARLNNHIAQEGLKGSYGLKVGKTLWENRGLSLMGEGLSLRAIARTSAAADARMAGCSLPVMSNSGSGNQGLTVALPILSVVEDLGLSREKLLRALALGLYGPSLGVGCGVFGGWSPFGPPRTVSRSQGAFLAELDGRNALDLLRQYVGDEVLDDERLMSFPLGVCDDQGKVVAVRALFRADLHGRRVVTVGEIPEGTRVRFLRGSAESVLDGAREAARASLESLGRAPEWALAVGCYGRKCFLGPRAEEEILEVAGALGSSVPLSGFLSYGELAPVSGMGRGCLFHNETMTVTAFAED
ncbi:MAG: Serine dehydratase alpha chain [Synergistetes bacterium ADurb.Bin520]|nr:MAG: Serine dehydratase alpha chain [Synergistetes bacterium ADurb.Bin520]